MDFYDNYNANTWLNVTDSGYRQRAGKDFANSTHNYLNINVPGMNTINSGAPTDLSDGTWKD